MENYICITCGTQYPASPAAPTHCPICEDDRQYINQNGQQWTTLAELRRERTNELTLIDPNLTAIRTAPLFAIAQQAHLIQTPAGNVLWDCISFLDDDDRGRSASAWRDRGDRDIAPTLLQQHDRMESRVRCADLPARRESPVGDAARSDAVQFWHGDAQELLPGLTVLRSGGHFPGSSVLHWADGAGGKGALFTADTIMVVADRRFVTFMYSYPNYIPLNARAVRGIVAAVEPVAFDRIYGSWPGSIVARMRKRQCGARLSATSRISKADRLPPGRQSTRRHADSTSACRHYLLWLSITGLTRWWSLGFRSRPRYSFRPYGATKSPHTGEIGVS